MRSTRFILIGILAVAALVSWGLGIVPQADQAHADAAEGLQFTSTSAETLSFSAPVGFITVEAVTDSVYFRVLGSYLTETSANGRIGVAAGDAYQWDGYSAGRRALNVGVYPTSGATAVTTVH